MKRRKNKIAVCLCVFVLVFIVSCSPRLYTPTQITSNWVSENIHPVTVMQLEQGKINYLRYCQQCHTLRNPQQFAKNEWDRIFPTMSVRINIPDSAKQIIYDYIVAGARDVKAK